jgi:TrmH family RNA methyltransferase
MKIITSKTNPRLQRVRRLQIDRRFRKQEKAFVVEGSRWLSELVHSSLVPEILLATDRWLQDVNHQQLVAATSVPATLVDSQLMKMASSTKSPSGVLAVIPMVPQPLPKEPTLLLILDRVTNPGNLGTILRTSSAAGVDGVLLTPGCVDPYNPKVVRGGMGTHIRLPIVSVGWPEIREVTKDMNVWVADAKGDISYTEANWRPASVLVVGNEAQGAGEDANQLAGNRVFIPMQRSTESLNAAVAAAIFLFEVVRQRNC